MTKETICKGIRIKYACGGSAAGLIYPIYIFVSNLSKAEFPNEQFVIVPINGLTTTNDVDPRCKKVGYMCLVGYTHPHIYIFHWFNEYITYHMVKHTRRKCNPLSTSDAS